MRLGGSTDEAPIVLRVRRVTSASAGLCGTCQHSRVVETKRGSTFRLCQRSTTDPRFPRYPTLPVLRCIGYEATDDARDRQDVRG